MAYLGKPIQILIIEENTGDARFIRENLQKEVKGRFELRHAKKLSTGLKRIVEIKPDIVLLNLDLPDSQGLATFSKIQEKDHKVPIIILTGLMDTNQAIKAMQDGAQDYLVKGEVSSKLLIQAIQYAIERKQAEIALRESEVRFRSIFENSTIGIYHTTPDGQILLANTALLDMLGYEKFDELAQRNLEKSGFEPEYPRSEFRNRIEKYGIVQGLESAWKRKDGTTIFIRESARVVRDEKGKVAYYQGTVEDLSEQKETEKSLYNQAEKLDSLQQIILDITMPHQLPDLLQTIVEHAAHLLKADGGGLYLCDPELREARNVVSYKTKHDYAGTVLKYGDGAAGIVAETGKPLLIDDYRYWPNRAVVYENDQPFRAVVSVPMLWHGQVTGVLHVLRSENNDPFLQSDVDLLSTFANHAAVAAENVKLLQNLRDSEEQYRRLFESVPVGIGVADRNGQLMNFNDAMLVPGGYTREEIYEIGTVDLLYADSHQREDVLEILRKSGYVNKQEVRFKRKDGTLYDALISLTPIQLKDQSIVQAMVEDVTERKKADEALRESEEKHRLVLDNVDEIIYQLSIEDENLMSSSLNFVSKQCQIISGYTPKEFLGDDSLWSALIHPDDITQVQTHTQRMLKDKKRITRDYRLRHKTTGQYRWIEDRISPQVDHSGKLIGMFGVARDVTDRKIAEQALQESEEKYRSLFEDIPVGVYRTSLEGKHLAVNQALVDILGYDSAEELLAVDVYTNYSVSKIRDHLVKETLEHGGIKNIETTQIRKDGREILVLDTSQAVYDDQGNFLHFEGTITDITAWRQAEKQVAESEAKYRSLFENVPHGVYRTTPDGRFLEANPALVKLFGCESESELLNSNVIDSYINQKDREKWMHEISESDELFNTELYLKRKDGQEIIGLDNSRAVRDESGNIMYFEGTLTDITAIKHAEMALRTSNEFNDVLLQTIPFGMEIVDEGGHVLYMNDALKTIIGENANDLRCWELYKDDQNQCTNCPLNSEIEIGVTKSIETRDIFGGRIFEINHTGMLYDGKKAVLEVFRDITHRKQAEESVAAKAEELRLRNDELDRLYRASGSLILSSTLDLQRLSQIIVDTILNEFKQSNCSLLLLEELSPELNRIAVTGPYSDEVASKRLTLDGNGLVPEAVRQGKLINEGDVSSRKEYVPNWEAARSELVIPLMVGDAVTGVIDVQSVETNAFNDDDERLMLVYARQAAMALERARLFESEQRRSTRLNALQDLANDLATLHTEKEVLNTLVERGAALASSPTCSVVLLDTRAGEALLVAQVGLPEKTSHNLRIPLQFPIIQQAIETGEPIIISDIDHVAPEFRSVLVRPDINAFYAFPILNEATVMGFITLSSLVPRSLSVAEKTTYELLAKLASVTLHNVRLFEHTSRNLERLASLRTVDIAIATSFDLSVTIDVLLQQVTDKLKVDAATVLLHDPEEHTLKFARNRGFRTQALRHTSLRVGEGYAGRVALERRTVSIPNLKKETRELTQSPSFYDEGFVSYLGFPLIAKGQIKGVLEVFNRTPLNPDQEWLDFLSAMADQAAIAIDNTELFQSLQQSNAELSLAYDNTLEGWANALELRDEETEGHTRRVTDLTVKLAVSMGLRNSNFIHIRRGALLHDIGKMGIPDEILLKPGPLSEEEWVIMRKHPVYAYNWLSRINYLRPALDIPYNHHEKWNGSGYPRGLKGEQIPMAARIFAVVDVWDALCSDRPYRKAWTSEKALEYIREQSGAHFDPVVVETFLKQIVDVEA